MYQKTSWNKYYTPKSIASEIVSMVPDTFVPNSAIDICVGSGNFLVAVKNKWSNTDLIGFDINKVKDDNNIKYKFHQINALIIKDLIEKTTKYKSNKIVLANPPFGQISHDIIYKNIVKKYLSIHQEAFKTNRIEALMLVSNLSILNKGDYFGAIIPENFFNSEKLRKFKELFIHFFDDITIGESKKYFSGSEVKTRIFLGRFNNKKVINTNILKNKRSKEKKIKLLRGIDNSKLIKEEELSNLNTEYKEVLHFSNKIGINKSKRFIKSKNDYNKLIVTKGDSLILRVGRNTGYSYSIKKDFLNKYISDYFYLLKGISLDDKEHLILQKSLFSKRKGLTTSYLSKYDIIDSINDILDRRI
jgi:predicted RNA methylase